MNKVFSSTTKLNREKSQNLNSYKLQLLTAMPNWLIWVIFYAEKINYPDIYNIIIVYVHERIYNVHDIQSVYPRTFSDSTLEYTLRAGQTFNTYMYTRTLYTK